jgi:hypothetical protein
VTCTSAHSLVHGGRGEVGSDRASPRRRERKGGCTGQRLSAWQNGPARQREKERASEETSADRLAPLGSKREREGTREIERATADRRGPPVRRHERAGAWPG